MSAKNGDGSNGDGELPKAKISWAHRFESLMGGNDGEDDDGVIAPPKPTEFEEDTDPGQPIKKVPPAENAKALPKQGKKDDDGKEEVPFQDAEDEPETPEEKAEKALKADGNRLALAIVQHAKVAKAMLNFAEDLDHPEKVINDDAVYAALLAAGKLKGSFAQKDWASRMQTGLDEVAKTNNASKDSDDVMVGAEADQLIELAKDYAITEDEAEQLAQTRFPDFIMKAKPHTKDKNGKTHTLWGNDKLKWQSKKLDELTRMGVDATAGILLSQMIENDPNAQLPEAIVDGMLRQGDLVMLVASPKMGKTWISYDLALAMISGNQWMHRNVKKGRVLLVDGEMRPQTTQHRLMSIAKYHSIDLAAVAMNLEIMSLRGKNMNHVQLAADLRRRVGEFAMMIIDPCYRFFLPGKKENDDDAWREMLSSFESVTLETGSTVVAIHHSSKGDQSTKQTTDVGSGSGVISRFPDVHLAIVRTSGQNKDQATLKMEFRTFPPQSDTILKAMGGDVCRIWDVDVKATQENAMEEKEAEEPVSKGKDLLDAMKFAAICATPEPESKNVILGRRKHVDKKMSLERAKYLFDICTGKSEWITPDDPKKQRNVRYSRAPNVQELYNEKLANLSDCDNED